MSWLSVEPDQASRDDRPAEDILSPATLSRLRASSGGPGYAAVFTTAALPTELGALGRVGLRPLAVVRGSSLHHVGLPGVPTAVSSEVAALTRSLYTARRFAVARLVAAASVLGAVGVVGVRVDHHPRAFGSELVEIVAHGTAVAGAGVPTWDGRVAPAVVDPTPPGYQPWTTALDGEDTSLAVAAGMLPVAVVFGTCVHHLDRRAAPETEWPGQEVPGWTQAVADAREVALARLQAEAQRCRADGVIGLHDQELDHGWTGEAIEYLVTGSAVRQSPRGATPPVAPAPRPAG